MSRKKLLIIISIFFALLALVLYFVFQNRNTPPASQSAGPKQVTGSALPNLPSSPVSVRHDETVPASITGYDAAIQKAFTDFSSQKPAGPLEWSKISDSNNQPVSLDKFSRAVGMVLEPKLKNILDDRNYDLFACNDGGKISFGINMNVRLLPSYNGNLYQDEVGFMRAWESSLFQDTAKVIFPNFNFTYEQLIQPTVFKDGVYRYADIHLPDDTTSSLNYALIDDYVIISSSSDCLKRALAEVYSTSN